MKWVVTEIISTLGGGYGLVVRLNGEQVRRFEDVTWDYDRLQDLSQRINEGRVHPVHIDDVIEDFLD
jgi:hypothetical protein